MFLNRCYPQDPRTEKCAKLWAFGIAALLIVINKRIMESRNLHKWYIVIFLLLISVLRWAQFWNCTNPGQQKAFVLLSSNLNLRYLFLLPFTVSLWKRLGIESIVLFTGNKKMFSENHQASDTVKILKEFNVTIMYFEPVHLSATSLSQIIRLFGGVLSIPDVTDESIILTSDADLAVFKLSNHIPSYGKRIHLYNSDCCGSVNVPPKAGNFLVKMFPMGTIAATKKTWREIMGFKKRHFLIEDIEKYIIEEFGDNFFHSTDDSNFTLVGSPIWYADQSLFSYKFDSWIKKIHNKHFVSYHSEAPKRIDRIKWPKAQTFSLLNMKNFDDAHLPVSVYSKNDWEKFLPFVNFVFKNDTLLIQRFTEYRNSFCKFLKC